MIADPTIRNAYIGFFNHNRKLIIINRLKVVFMRHPDWLYILGSGSFSYGSTTKQPYVDEWLYADYGIFKEIEV